MRLNPAILTLALGALTLPALAGVHFNAELNGGRYEPSGSIGFGPSGDPLGGPTEMLILDGNSTVDHLDLDHANGLGASLHFDVGHWNFGMRGWRNGYHSKLPGYDLDLNMMQAEAFVSYEWDLAKYVPGVAFQLGPQAKVVRTNVELEANMSGVRVFDDEMDVTTPAIGGRLHLGFVKDLIQVKIDASIWPSGDRRYRDLQGRFAIHPLPFLHFGVGYRDQNVEDRSGKAAFAGAPYDDNHLDMNQRGAFLFIAFRIGAGGS